MKFLIVYDHKIIREGLKQIIWKHFPMATCDEAETGEDVLTLVSNVDYNVVICDLSALGRGGLDVISQIKESHPKLPVLVLSTHSGDHYAARALKVGAWGYLGKT